MSLEMAIIQKDYPFLLSQLSQEASSPEMKSAFSFILQKKILDVVEFFCLNGFEYYPYLENIVISGKVDVMLCLASCGADVNYVGERKKSLLEYSVLKGDLKMVQCLIVCGADVTSNLLNLALALGKIKIVELLLEWCSCGEEERCHLLKRAVVGGDVDTVRSFLKYSDVNYCDENCLPVLVCAISTKNIEMILCLLEFGADPNSVDHNGNSILMNAVATRCVEIVSLLLKYDVNVSYVRSRDGISALKLAVSSSEYDITQTLLERLKSPLTDNIDALLSLACFAGNPQIAGLLIKSGAKINNNINQSIHFLTKAIEEMNCDMIAILEQSGIDINHINNQGHTPLWHAVNLGSLEVVKCLVEHGAIVNYDKHISLLDLALSKGDINIISYLAKSGARRI